jgi:hypothetical protein
MSQPSTSNFPACGNKRPNAADAAAVAGGRNCQAIDHTKAEYCAVYVQPKRLKTDVPARNLYPVAVIAMGEGEVKPGSTPSSNRLQGGSECFRVRGDASKNLGPGVIPSSIEQQAELQSVNIFSQLTKKERRLLLKELVASRLAFHAATKAQYEAGSWRELIYNVQELSVYAALHGVEVCPVLCKFCAAVIAQRSVKGCKERHFRQIIRIYCTGNGLCHNDKSVIFRKIDVRMFSDEEIHCLGFWKFNRSTKGEQLWDVCVKGTGSFIMQTELSGSKNLESDQECHAKHQYQDKRPCAADEPRA